MGDFCRRSPSKLGRVDELVLVILVQLVLFPKQDSFGFPKLRSAGMLDLLGFIVQLNLEALTWQKVVSPIRSIRSDSWQ